MPGKEITIPTADDRMMPAYFATPDGEAKGPLPALLIIHEIFGLTPEIRRVADRMAERGYAALVPDLYHRGGAKLMCIVRALRDFKRGRGDAFQDLDTAAAWLDQAPSTSSEQVGVMGFCMGGGFALLMAVRRPFGAAAAWYGEVPKEAEALSGACPIVASYGARDRPLKGHGERLQRHLQVVAPEHEHDVKVYPEAGHAFAFPPDVSAVVQGLSRLVGMNAAHVPEAADDAWSRVDSFFADHLGG